MNNTESIIEKLYKQKCYRWIIIALELYEPNVHPSGMTQKHFRFLFGDRSNLDPQTIQELEKFFKQFEWLGKDIFKPETMTQGDINYYLKFLREKKIIKPLNRCKPIRYKLTKLYDRNCWIARMNEYLNKWNINERDIQVHSNESFSIFFSNNNQDIRIYECINEMRNNIKKIIEIKKEIQDKTSVDFYLHAEG